jgi:hypothetical protein
MREMESDKDRIRMHIEAASREDLLDTLRHTAESIEHAHRKIDSYQWVETVEHIRREHNGVMRIDLYFGHDGDNVCRFSSYDKELAKGESGHSMQEAVERCVSAWHLEVDAIRETKYEWDTFIDRLTTPQSENTPRRNPKSDA